MKRKFLTVYDYGTGGVWRYMWAPDREAIRNKYPGLSSYPDPNFQRKDSL